MIQTENLTFAYKNTNKIFHFPDIQLVSNENLLIHGESGIGKTTFLHLLAGLLTPDSGNIYINQKKFNKLKNSDLDKFRGSQIGLIFQKKHAIRSLNVIENLEARLLFCKQKINHTLIDELLSELSLLPYKKNKIQHLSEGQLQRLGIAMAIVHRPKIILADEPTASLDDNNAKNVMELLINQSKKNDANLVVITHDQRVKPFFEKTITL